MHKGNCEVLQIGKALQVLKVGGGLDIDISEFQFKALESLKNQWLSSEEASQGFIGAGQVEVHFSDLLVDNSLEFDDLVGVMVSSNRDLKVYLALLLHLELLEDHEDAVQRLGQADNVEVLEVGLSHQDSFELIVIKRFGFHIDFKILQGLQSKKLLDVFIVVQRGSHHSFQRDIEVLKVIRLHLIKNNCVKLLDGLAVSFHHRLNNFRAGVDAGEVIPVEVYSFELLDRFGGLEKSKKKMRR